MWVPSPPWKAWVGARLRKCWWFCLNVSKNWRDCHDSYMNGSLFLEKLVFGSTFKFLGCISPLPRQIRCRKGLNFYFSLFISRGQNRIVHPWFCYRVVVEIPEPHISPTCIIFVVSPWATNNMTNRPIYNSNEFYSSEILKGVLHLWALFLKTLCIFSKNKPNLDLVRNVPRNSKITVSLQ